MISYCRQLAYGSVFVCPQSSDCLNRPKFSETTIPIDIKLGLQLSYGEI